MSKGVFTTKVNPTYDDVPEERYHIPHTYLKQAQQTVGDWIVYYEPRRQDDSPDGRAGRSVYFATAYVDRIEPDPRKANHYYAFVGQYLEFVHAVPFKSGREYFEAKLRGPDDRTNRGAFQRAVRTMDEHEYQAILHAGFKGVWDPEAPSVEHMVSEEAPEYGVARQRRIIARPVRDQAFTHVVQTAYNQTCAMTGLKLINGGGRCEIEAAHIRPVADNGPDSPRNGLALSRTAHWLFDRGLVSLADDGEILIAKRLLPKEAARLLNRDRHILTPPRIQDHPHPLFLRYHRENIFKGD